MLYILNNEGKTADNHEKSGTVCISYLTPPPRKALIPRYISRNFVVSARSTSAPQKPTRIRSETGEMLTQRKQKKHFHNLGIYSFTNTKEIHIQLLPEYIHYINKINSFIIKLASFYKWANIISTDIFFDLHCVCGYGIRLTIVVTV